MQALSIWPPMADQSVVTQLDFELGSSCNSFKRRKNPSSSFVSTNSWAINCCCNSNINSTRGSFKNPVLDFGCGHVYKHSKVKFYVFCDPNVLAPDEQDSLKTESKGLNGSKQPLNENIKIEKKSERVDVRALGSALKLAKNEDDVDEVLKDIGGVPPQVYSSLIRGLGKENRVDSALAIVNWLKKKKKEDPIRFTGPNLFVYNSLLGALKQAGKYQEAENVVNDMMIEGVNPNVVTYNALMGVYLEKGKELEALSLFKEIKKKGLMPSPASYSTALLAYRRLEDGFGALSFYVDTREKYQKGELVKDGNDNWDSEIIKLDDFIVRICYQVMRRWLVKSGDFSTDVLRLLSDMDKFGLETGRPECERLVWACTREEHYVVAKELYNRIRKMGDSEISLSVCNHVIWLMGKSKKWWAALEIYEDLLDKGPKPNNMSYELVVSHFNTLLMAARRRGIWKWGVRLLNKMEEKGLKPGPQEWNSVLVACSKAAETNAAIQIFRRMVEKGEKPNVVSYGALLSALEKGKLYVEALRVWKHMLKVGIEPNSYAYTIMASIYAAQGKFDLVEKVVKEMSMAEIGPTVVTFNAIITASARSKMGNHAYEWFQRMRGERVEPNEVSYEILIGALSDEGKPRLAYDLYMRAYNEGLSLSSKAYDSVVRSLEAYGATADVSKMGPRPAEKVKMVRKVGKEFSRKEIYSSYKERGS